MLFPADRMLKHPVVTAFKEMLSQEKAEIGKRASMLLVCWPMRLSGRVHNMPDLVTCEREWVTSY